MIYKYICSKTKINGIPDHTDYSLKDKQIQYYRIYYTEPSFFFQPYLLLRSKMYVSQ